MHTKDAIKFALTASNEAVLGVDRRDERRADDVSHAERRLPSALGARSPGAGRGMIPAVLFGEANPAAEWRRLFGEQSEPVADAAAYPPFAEVRDEVRAAARAQPRSCWTR